MGPLEQLIIAYGPGIIFAGTFLEGETIVVMAGFLAHQGILNPGTVAVCAFLGSFLGDQLWFYLGRRHALNPLVTRITRRPAFEKVLAAINGHPKKFILTFRFLYGIRTISPIAIGLSDIKVRDFVLLNAIAAAIWAIAFTVLGYVFGKAFETVLGEVKAIEQKALIAVAIAGVVFVAYQVGLRLKRYVSGQQKPVPTPKGD